MSPEETQPREPVVRRAARPGWAAAASKQQQPPHEREAEAARPETAPTCASQSISTTGAPQRFPDQQPDGPLEMAGPPASPPTSDPNPAGGTVTPLAGVSAVEGAPAPMRRDGYAPIEDYAAIGDGRTVALVARDGAIDWLCLPDLDSASVFAALLDAKNGGSFQLHPEQAFTVQRRYLPDTNVLETTFHTAEGVVRVTDALLLPGGELAPGRELARRVEGLSGRVGLVWRVEPRFGYATSPTRIELRSGIPVATSGAHAAAICSWGTGQPHLTKDAVEGSVEVEAGSTALITLCTAHQEPLVFPARDEVERRLAATEAFWRRWARNRTYQGPWQQAVVRSALALKLLFFAPSGAVAAAATSSLPECIGGERNWDYRYSWVRDAAFTVDALQRLGCLEEADSYFWWLLHASQLTHPRLQVLYRLDGGAHSPERSLPFDGYRHSRPVRIGNAAADQVQLDIYGELLQTAWLRVRAGARLDSETARRLADHADLVCHIWDQPDSGIFEVRSEPVHFTHSKLLCWVALDRAIKLAHAGQLPSTNQPHWQEQAAVIRAFIDNHCWSPDLGSYVRHAGSQELGAGVLFAALLGYDEPSSPRLHATIDTLRRKLGHGPLLFRYSGEDGLRGEEGAFLPASFWLVGALARTGHLDEATVLMDQLVGLANDVGLYAEEIDPATGTFLGNFPQALVHLALINAASSLSKAAQ